MMTRLLIFHPTVAPYRIDFFNDLSEAFRTRICLRYWNLRDQTFDYQHIYARFRFKPHYLKEAFRLRGGRSFSIGYWKQLEDFRPDVVLTEEFGLGTWMVLLHRFLRRRKYKVVTLCDDSFNMVAEANDFSRIHRWSRRMVTPLIDNLIVVEPKVEDWYRTRYGKGFCFPIIQDEDMVRSQYAKVVERSRGLQTRYALKGKRVFLFVGRLVALKNVETIIRAFARMNPQENALVIVGDGPEKDNLMHLSDALNVQALFVGRQEGDALKAWYVLADVFILASVQEAFGAVTNEALLAGCMALVSRKAGSSSLIEEGMNGFTFEPTDVETLARLMQNVSAMIEKREDVCLKPNRMSVSYRECMDKLVHFLASSASHQ